MNTYNDCGFVEGKKDEKWCLYGIYLNEKSGKMNINKGYELIKEVNERSDGSDLFYCCEFAGGRWIRATSIKDLMDKAEKFKNNQ
jgi:hypothetical protein